MLDGFAHQDVPFERVVDELHEPVIPAGLRCSRPWSCCRTPRADPGAGRSGHLGVDLPVATAHSTSASSSEIDDGLAGAIDYNTDLFDPATIERMARIYMFWPGLR